MSADEAIKPFSTEEFTDLDLKRIRDEFPILGTQVHGKPLVYLDSAATMIKPKRVCDAVDNHYRYKASNVHRGIHFLSEQATTEYEAVRDQVKDFINAADRSEVVFTKGTTESVNLVMQSYGRRFLQEGDEILISHMEHHSNIVPWQMLCEEKGCVLKVIPMNDNGELIWEEFEKLLSPKTKLMAIVHVSNTLGTVNPIKKMIAKAREFDVPVLVDGAQAVAHMKVDVQDLDCDFYAFSAHKIFGPTGVGVLYGKAALLEKMPPMTGGGAIIDSVTFDKTTYLDAPFKFEAGTPHIAGVIGFGEALRFVNEMGLTRIHNYEDKLWKDATKKLQAIEGVRLIGTAKDKSSIVSFVVDGAHPHDLGTLVDMEGVALRTGHHCTQPVMQHFGVPGTLRASFAVYNTPEDIDQFIFALNKAKGML